ncbi:MAG: molybdopterin-guanine dinucleotide biosynthesis protein B [Lachnospiraceae bacterium]|nr:molybdopterin-guanine dinucleotide biosynthesis protein B [Lachnospiraceae bacterium]
MVDDRKKETIPIFSFIAWSHTGKTTFLEKLIGILSDKGYRVAAVKHDGHDFSMDKEGKDTKRMTDAGAVLTGIVSGTHAALLVNEPVALPDFLQGIRDVDLILLEGYERGIWPKILLHRRELKKPPRIPLNECVAVITDDELILEPDVPVFGFEEADRFADFLLTTGWEKYLLLSKKDIQ